MPQTRWLYEHDEENSARFVLGTVGSNPLISFGINPSRAKPNDLDRTADRVSRIASSHGHDSWIMLNISPQIATNPNDMHRVFVPELKAENERQIAAVTDGRAVTLLAAWGVLIDKRTYLRPLLRDILALPAFVGRDWMSLGVTAGGHPRHPSRIAAGVPLRPFDVDPYR